MYLPSPLLSAGSASSDAIAISQRVFAAIAKDLNGHQGPVRLARTACSVFEAIKPVRIKIERGMTPADRR